MKNIIIGIITS